MSWFSKALLSMFLIAIIADSADAQSRVRIMESDILRGAGDDLRKLIGNVRLQTDDFIIVCDSAYHYQRQERIEAFGNIEIITDDDRIWADYVNYDVRREISRFEGRVVLKNDNTTIFSTSARFYHKTDVAIFPVYLRLEDENGVLTAESGMYYNKLDSMIFRGAVQIVDSTQYIEADSLFGNRKAGNYELFGQVHLYDGEQNTIIKGNYVRADSTGFRMVTGNSRMKRLDGENQDTTYVWANRLLIWEQDTTYRFEAYEDVHIWTTSYASLADTALYDDTTEIFELLGKNPKLWYDEIQLSGPFIEVQLKDEKPHFLKSYLSPFVVQRDTVTQRLHQITGDSLFIRFVDGDLHTLHVIANPHVYYHSQNDQNEPDGALELQADQFIILYFEDGDIHDGVAKKQNHGTFHPESKEVLEKRLDGFIWTPEMRPIKPTNQFNPQYGEIPDDRPIDLPPLYIRYLRSLR